MNHLKMKKEGYRHKFMIAARYTLAEADCACKTLTRIQGGKQFSKIHLKGTLRILSPTNSLKKNICEALPEIIILHRKPK